MALVFERSAVDAFQAVVRAEAHRLQAVGGIENILRNRTGGSGLSVTSVDRQEGIANRLDLAVIAEYDVLDARQTEAAAAHFRQIGGERQRLDAVVQRTAGKSVIARRNESAVPDRQIVDARTEVDLSQIALVFERAVTDPGQRIALAQIDALQAVAGLGDLFRGKRIRLFKMDPNLVDVIK